MTGAQDSKSTTPPANPQFGMAHPDMPEPKLEGGPAKRFKLKLTLPGKNIGGQWLCRASGDALAYQKYCSTGGTELVFSEYQEGGKTYLQTQEGQWLSYERLSSCLYVYNWVQRASWKIEDNRLIGDDDNGRILTWDDKQRWPLSSGIFLQAMPQSENTVTVERVEV